MQQTLLQIQLAFLFFYISYQVQSIEWGQQFNEIDSWNLNKSCTSHTGKPICCSSILSKSVEFPSRGVGKEFQPKLSINQLYPHQTQSIKCEVSKVYISSPQELREFEMAAYLQSVPTMEERRFRLFEYFSSNEVTINSTKWLQRVAIHSSREQIAEPVPDDFEFMSRFHYTRTCYPSIHFHLNKNNNNNQAGSSTEIEVHEWDEWIEPLTVHARHPFGYHQCLGPTNPFKNHQYFTHSFDPNNYYPPYDPSSSSSFTISSISSNHKPTSASSKHPFILTHPDPSTLSGKTFPRAGIMSFDYVLVQSGVQLYNQTHSFSGRPILLSQPSSLTSSTISSSHRQLRSNFLSTGYFRPKKSSSTSASSSSSPQNTNNNNNNNNIRIINKIPREFPSTTTHKDYIQRKQNLIRDSDRRHFMLDAGSSTFDSSLLWFTCMYSQREISFDSVSGWEMTLLEPVNYWERVPDLWKPFWHFYNTPISSQKFHSDNPMTTILQQAKEEDFVSFKLDIDTPDVEMEIAMDLLADPSPPLVDEFLFELHFQCEIMMYCGWGDKIPPTSHGLELNRLSVMNYFLKLRQKGIRAHFWP